MTDKDEQPATTVTPPPIHTSTTNSHSTTHPGPTNAALNKPHNPATYLSSSNPQPVPTTNSNSAALPSSYYRLEPNPQDDIHGYVVRDLWRRSRVPDDTLSRIWDLVDRNHNGTLDRESFLVGMWLVDQCLYGRKLPHKIDDAIWKSVSRLGVTVEIIKEEACQSRILTIITTVKAIGNEHLMQLTISKLAQRPQQVHT